MNHLFEKLEQLKLKETILNDQMETCTAYLTALLDFTVQEGTRYHHTAIEKIALAVHFIEMDLRTEYCHLKLAQALVSSEIHCAEGATA
ncbi:hypothetical protein [Paenibacillus sp. UMB4589-SE434]|uniref:hypothetical protein n=1 Tax=Paenibacillus sp. UMB4589-SE434 TaxID=3046314 RepID=UPI00254A329B|nr:hypothetical protein [Paenibacillus sp. UMB4589-SE434]MDK8182623.1 hypothetical protein [Paenibacillus sp. UMB4589-SE434]